jgi:hypothetical protein
MGAAVGVAGLISLVSGNIRRTRLIYKFSTSAFETNVQVEAGQREGLSSLQDYKSALLRLGAYEQATAVSRLIEARTARRPAAAQRPGDGSTFGPGRA